MMLALGLVGRIVGAASLDGPIPTEYGVDEFTLLSDNVPH
jgi:hypothetical protein